MLIYFFIFYLSKSLMRFVKLFVKKKKPKTVKLFKIFAYCELKNLKQNVILKWCSKKP